MCIFRPGIDGCHVMFCNFERQSPSESAQRCEGATAHACVRDLLCVVIVRLMQTMRRKYRFLPQFLYENTDYEYEIM